MFRFREKGKILPLTVLHKDVQESREMARLNDEDVDIEEVNEIARKKISRVIKNILG